MLAAANDSPSLICSAGVPRVCLSSSCRCLFVDLDGLAHAFSIAASSDKRHVPELASGARGVFRRALESKCE
jgi:hypothetical protein